MVNKPPPHAGKPWSAGDKRRLKTLAARNTPTGVIGLKLGRTRSAIYNQASAQGVPLMPTNQSPYNRQRKKP